MPIENIIETISPVFELYPTNNCIKVCYEGVDIVQQIGTPAFLTITQSMYSKIQDGSTMTINGVTYVFDSAAIPSLENFNANIIPFVFQPVLQSYVTNAIIYNSKLPKELIVQSFLLTTTLTMRDCGKPLEVVFTGLTGSLSTETLSSYGTELTLLENYRMRTCFQNAVTKKVLGEVDFFPYYTLSDDKCEIETIEVCKDISDLLACYLKKTLPTFDGDYLTLMPESALYWETLYGERFGSPLNTYGKGLSSQFRKAVNGAYQNGNAGQFDEYAVGFDHKLITSYNSGDVICDNQEMAIYIDTAINTNIIILGFELLNEQGGQIISAIQQIFQLDTLGQLMQINASPFFVIDYFSTSFEFDPCDVKSIKITTNQLGTRGEIGNTLEFEYFLDCCNCSETFLFCSTLGVYETISTKCVDNESISVIREFIDLCYPCEPGTSARGRTGISAIANKRFECYHWDESDRKFNKDIICEFMQSKDVYWIKYGKFYAIELLTNESELRGKAFSDTTDKGFSFQLMQIRN